MSVIAAGLRHLMALSEGKVFVWQSSYTNNKEFMNIPSDLPLIRQIAAGNDVCVALDFEGKVYSWGKITKVPELPQIIQIAARNDIVMALSIDGKVFSWGTDYYQIPTDLPPIIKIAAGDHNLMALSIDGKMFFFSNKNKVPNNLPLISNVVAGEYQYVALSVDGTVIAYTHDGNHIKKK
jgi:alpha-tubulin suppressor-like RCC1 family protein